MKATISYLYDTFGPDALARLLFPKSSDPKQLLWRYLNGKRALSIAELDRLAEALGVQTRELMEPIHEWTAKQGLSRVHTFESASLGCKAVFALNTGRVTVLMGDGRNLPPLTINTDSLTLPALLAKLEQYIKSYEQVSRN